MAESGSLYQNVIAERMDGILKEEVRLDKTFGNHKNLIEKTIEKYNTLRPRK